MWRTFRRSTRPLYALVALALIHCTPTAQQQGPPPPADQVFLGGTVLTVNADNGIAEAVAVTDGRVVFVGRRTTAEQYIGAATQTVDLAGGTMVPGFVDAHSHFPGSGVAAAGVVDLNSPPIGSVQTLADLIEQLAAQAAKEPDGDWVRGIGYDDTLLAEGRHPTRVDLDMVSTTHPVFAMHTSGHLGVVNSMGLAVLGIDETTPDPPGGVIRREEGSNTPNGVLEEKALDEVNVIVADFSITESVAIAQASTDDYLSQGVTTAQSGLTSESLANGLSTLATIGELRVRLVVWPDEVLATSMLDGSVAFEEKDELLSFGAVKLVADGSIQGYTGYLSEPYHVPPEGEDADYRGYPRISAEELAASVLQFHQAGWQIAVHGNGDAAIDDILDAVEAAQTASPRSDARTILIHAQMARDDQLDRMTAIDVTPSFFSLHTYYWGDRHRDIFMGPERAARMSPAASAIQRGLRFSIHTDTPVVPMDPLRLMWSAVNRISTSGAVLGEAQRISPEQALRAVTIDSAWQLFLSEDRGSIEVGKLADFAVLSDNPLNRPETIADIEVLQTWLGAELVYDGPSSQ